MNAVTGRVGRHYAWPLSGPSPATIGALVQVAGMLSDTNREPRPACGNRRSGVLIVRPGRLDRVISRPLAGVSTRPRHHAGSRSPSRRSGARRSLSAHEYYGTVGRASSSVLANSGRVVWGSIPAGEVASPQGGRRLGSGVPGVRRRAMRRGRGHSRCCPGAEPGPSRGWCRTPSQAGAGPGT
jgi:hypothetical protein